MKKILTLAIASSMIFVGCSNTVTDRSDRVKYGVDDSGNTSVKINTDSGTDVSVYSSGVSVSVGSGNVDVQTDETLKDIDKIIDDISSEDAK